MTNADVSYCYDHADRLVSATPSIGTISYDNHGNTTAIFGETHTYDSADRHMSTTKGGTTVTYKRDALDRIVERVEGSSTVRYAFGGAGDSSGFTLNSSSTIVERTLSLPGGAILTTRSGGNVWSYPNIHGDIVATANEVGIKQGSTRHYDPYGNLVGTGTVPDNSAGNFDYGWLGQHQRGLDHASGLEPVVQMGARQYSPRLGRFLQVDPVEGGSCNDYEYTCADPVNGRDLTGRNIQDDLDRIWINWQYTRYKITASLHKQGKTYRGPSSNVGPAGKGGVITTRYYSYRQPAEPPPLWARALTYATYNVAGGWAAKQIPVLGDVLCSTVVYAVESPDGTESWHGWITKVGQDFFSVETLLPVSPPCMP